MLKKGNCTGFEFAIRMSYVGTHLCGREAEEEDEKNYKTRMVRCTACDVLFAATNVRLYFDTTGMEHPDLIEEMSIDEFARRISEN